MTDTPQAKALYAIIVDGYLPLLRDIKPEWFWNRTYGYILASVAEILSTKGSVTLDSVVLALSESRLREKDKRDAINAAKGIVAASHVWGDGIPDALQEAYRDHEIGKLRHLFHEDSTPGEIVMAVGKAADAFRGISETDEPDNALALAKESMQRLEEGKSTKEAEAAIKLYDPELRKLFYSGLIYACPIVVGGRPGFGKTAIVVNVVLDAISSGHGVLVYNLENSSGSFTAKILGAKNDVPYTKIIMGATSKEEREKIKGSLTENLGNLHLRDRNMTIDQWERDCRKQLSTRKIHLVVIDFIQSFLDVGNGDDPAKVTLKLSKLMRTVKDISKEYMVAVMCLSQMNERKEDKKTGEVVLGMGDLKGSGAIEEFARQIILLMGNSAGDSRIMRLVKNEWGPYLEREFSARRDTGKITRVYEVRE